MRQPLRDMILKQAANGYTVHEIATALGLSDDTVRATIGQTRAPQHPPARQQAHPTNPLLRLERRHPMTPVEHTLLAIRTNLTQIEQISERQWNPAADMQTARRPPRAAHTTPLNFDACQALADATDELQAVLYVLDLPIPHGWRRTIITLIDHAEELDPYQPILAAVETKTRAYANPPTSQDQILGHYLCCTPKQLDAYITATYRLTIPPSTIRSWLHRGKLHAKQLAPNTYLVPVKTLENTLRAESATASE